MQSNATETIIGLIVVVVLGTLLFFAYSSSGSSAVTRGYDLKAAFSALDGISPGTDVRLNGIKIGTVSSMDIDPKTYQAVAHVTISKDVQLPDDSSIKCTSAGLLGGSYLAVSPGGSATNLAQGGLITNTQGCIDIASLIGRLVYGSTGSK